MRTGIFTEFSTEICRNSLEHCRRSVQESYFFWRQNGSGKFSNINSQIRKVANFCLDFNYLKFRTIDKADIFSAFIQVDMMKIDHPHTPPSVGWIFFFRSPQAQPRAWFQWEISSNGNACSEIGSRYHWPCVCFVFGQRSRGELHFPFSWIAQSYCSPS